MVLSSDFSIYYIACLLVGLGYAYFLYKNESLISSRLLKRFLFVSRFLFIGFVAALLLNPVVKSYNKIKEDPIVIFAQDISSSISGSNSFDMLNSISNELTDFEVHKFSFSDEVEQGFLTENNGLRTNYSTLLDELDSRFENQNVAALVIASDGLYNSGANPLYREQSVYPIYTLAQGDTVVKPEVSIIKVKQNDIAFLGNTFPLEVAVLAKECEGEKVQFSIWRKGKKLHSQEFIISSDDDYTKILVKLKADAVGLQKYTLKTTVLNNKKNIKSSSYTVYVDVIDSRYNILIVSDGSHPDIAAYKSAIESNKNYTTKSVDIANFEENIKAYQLVVLFGLPDNSSLLTDLNSQNIPVLSFDLQEKSYPKLTNTISFKERKGLEEVSAVKDEGFSKFVFSNDLENLISNAPPLYVPFGKFSLGLGTQNILVQKIGMLKTDNPVIVLSEQNNRKMAFVTAEGFWRWKLYDYANVKNNIAFNELFLKLTQYLILQEDKSKFHVNYKKQVDENAIIYFDATLYNDSYELVNDKGVSIIITNDKGMQFNYEFSKSTKDYNLKVGVLDIGHYKFTAKVAGTTLVKKGSFDVKEVQLEQLVTVANHQLLHQLSSQSGGSLFYSTEVAELTDLIKQQSNKYSRIRVEENLEGLINIPWILLSLLLFISLEWFLRKLNGLI